MKNLKGNVCLFVFLKSNKEKTDWERRQKTQGGWRLVSRGQRDFEVIKKGWKIAMG